MKKSLIFVLVTLLLCLPLLTLTGCNNTPDQPPVEPGNDPVTEPDEPVVDPPVTPSDDVVLVADGVAHYRIVRSDFANATVKALAIDLRNAIEAITGVKPELVSDFTDEKNNADIKEILVGKTNRPESSALISRLSGLEFGYEVNGSKLVLAGGSDALLAHAISSFLKTYAGYSSEEDYVMSNKLSVPSTLSFVQSNDHSRDVAIYTIKEDVSYLDALYSSLTKVSSSVSIKTKTDNVNDVFSTNSFGLVVIAGADTIPVEAKSAIDAYLKAGGRMLLLGGPTFEHTVEYYEWDGELLTLAEYAQILYDTVDLEDTTLLLDTTKSSTLNKLQRTTNDSSVSDKKSIDNYGLRGTKAQLYHEVPSVTNWDMLAFNVSVTTKNNNLILLQAKPGNENTEHFSFEVWEKDGTRWMSNVVFESTDWMTYMLTEQDFTYFQGPGSSRKAPDFDNINKIQIGYSTSFYSIQDGSMAYYLSEPMLCRVDKEIQTHRNDFDLELDGFAPLYEQYPITNAAVIVTENDQAFVTARDYVVPASLFSCHPGRQGNGFDKGSASRFIPLLRVTDEKGLHSGYAAWIYLYSSSNSANKSLEGAMVGCFSASSDDFYNADGIAAVTEAATAMMRNSFIVDGGANEFFYVKENTKSVTYGINYITLNRASTDGLSLQVSLYNGDTLLDQITSSLSGNVASSSGVRKAKKEYTLNGTYPDRAVACLIDNGKVFDKVEHAIRFWEPKSADKLSFVYTEDGYFKKDGKIINFFGVNYLPSYNAANYPEENIQGAYYNRYCDKAAYDPEVISYDLARIKDLGMNAISFSSNGASNNLLDLIMQCEDAGLYIDLTIGNAFPLKDFNLEAATSYLTTRYFDRIDSIFAYDIAWEPRIGAYDSTRYIGRKQWDDEFTAWVKAQYGSIETAETAWGAKADRTAQGYLLVSDAMLDDTTGKYQKLVAAYYRFLDDQISTEMTKLLSLQERIPNQLFSFRMSMAGSAYRTNSFKPSTHCFDFQSLATSMAFMEPEGYQLTANTGEITDATALQIPFINAYARYTQPDSPVVWKEFGKSVWTGGEMGNFVSKLAQQRSAERYYKYVMDYCYKSYTSAMFCWFYSGGYRVGEKSDYGILNPDGSDRLLTSVLREYAPKFITQGERKEADTVYIKVERDDSVGGIFGMFNSTKTALEAAIKEGKCVTFINAAQSKNGNYAYADTLLDQAVADAKTANGTYPLRYVNGLVKSLKTYTEDGKTYAEVVVCNTKQSTWRADTVSLVSTDDSTAKLSAVIGQEVGYLEDVTLKVPVTGNGTLTLRFEIDGVAFGPVFSAIVK